MSQPNVEKSEAYAHVELASCCAKSERVWRERALSAKYAETGRARRVGISAGPRGETAFVRSEHCASVEGWVCLLCVLILVFVVVDDVVVSVVLCEVHFPVVGAQLGR
jgi:hypothetical protein